METFNNLKIKGERSRLVGFLKKVTQQLPAEWKFDDVTSKSYAESSGKSTDEIVCIRSPSIGEKVALIWMGFWEGSLEVINIVPKYPGDSLTYEDYNAILDAFYTNCLKAHIYQLELEYHTSGIDFEAITGAETLDKLKTWEEACNPSNGNTHPLDFKRWTDFVITAHKEHSGIDSSLLTRWLVEERGWNEEFSVTVRMSSDFQYATDILKAYDEH